MRVKLLKNWGGHLAGEVVDLLGATGDYAVANGYARPYGGVKGFNTEIRLPVDMQKLRDRIDRDIIQSLGIPPEVLHSDDYTNNDQHIKNGPFCSGDGCVACEEVRLRELMERVSRPEVTELKHVAKILPSDPWATERRDAPNYGGWSEGDVMAELSRYGEAACRFEDWVVRRGLFVACFRYESDVWCADVNAKGEWTHHRDLPEAMRWAVERWRELVAESDPLGSIAKQGANSASPAQNADLGRSPKHIGTGDMTTMPTSMKGNGWSDYEGDDD